MTWWKDTNGKLEKLLMTVGKGPVVHQCANEQVACIYKSGTLYVCMCGVNVLVWRLHWCGIRVWVHFYRYQSVNLWLNKKLSHWRVLFMVNEWIKSHGWEDNRHALLQYILTCEQQAWTSAYKGATGSHSQSICGLTVPTQPVMWMLWWVKIDHNTRVYVPYSFRTVVWVLLHPTRTR